MTAQIRVQAVEEMKHRATDLEEEIRASDEAYRQRVAEIEGDVDMDRLLRSAVDVLNRAQHELDEAWGEVRRLQSIEKQAKDELARILQALGVKRISL